MSLYQNSVIKKYLKGLETVKVNEAYERFTSHFHNTTIQENIRNSKEEQYQGEFLIDLFVNVLGYVKNPIPDFNLTTELKNVKGAKKTDGAILKGDKALAVIELKGTNTTDLSKVETQAFGYKNNQPGCNYVITSNFEKLRFYIDNAVDFEEFNLFQLSKERFDMLWLCLSSEYLLKDIPKKIKDESLTQEENVTKKLYKDYASFRNEIFDAIQKENPEYDKLTLFKKTQKLLDRFLFIFFAEDRLLLPPNSIRSIVNQWTDLRDKYDAYFPLYDRFKKYFGYMNTGHKGQQHDIFAYNGGLFAPDEILNNIKINDDLLYKHTLNLSNYDFESEVSVNILGHIFEHSLTDIENIQAQIEGTEIDKSKSKRKKDGVFYTPKYITKYIVDNTVGKLCAEKKTELDIQEAEYEKERKGRQKATLKKLSQKLEDYRKWLLQITICDPACGSGAFLNQALEFLIAEHQYIDELQAKLFGDAMILSEVENAILENNLFGVDINEESVEIAKLSLWLRTAQKGRKLTTLNNNIKCGNSLIDDIEIAGDKAFNWQQEFPEVFKEKDKHAYHLVFTTHNSRVSQRMIAHNIKKGEPLELTLATEIVLTEIFKDLILENNYQVLAYNICKDHLHILLVCEEEELTNIVKILKGKSSYLFQSKGFKPLGKPLWSQKFFFAQLDEFIWADLSKKLGEVYVDSYLDNTLAYIQNNRNKHKLPQSDALDTLINQFVIPTDDAFKPEYAGGFDIIIGNPPYVQLQKKKEQSILLKGIGYKTYESTGDLYCLFYEKGNDVLKPKGLLGYITSNKWMRANYGKSLRKYFNEKTKPYILIDLGSGIFESATVDSNILLFEKSKTKEHSFKAIDLTQEKDFRDFTIYEEKAVEVTYKNDEIWGIESLIEKSIKQKIETNGTPLKEWDIEINYGIKTGYNEAFVIPKEKRDELIAKDPKSAEIIHPILRGRDIKRYAIDFADLYLINTHNGYKGIERIDVSDYPAIKSHLDEYYEKLEKRYDKGETPYNLRNCAYVNQFNKEKIIYQEMVQESSFAYHNDGKMFCVDTGRIITGSHLKFLLTLVNTKLFFWSVKNFYAGGGLGIKGVRMKHTFFEKFPAILPENEEKFIEKANQMLTLNKILQEVSDAFTGLLQNKFGVETSNGFQPIALSKKLKNWHELEFGEFLKELEKARKKAFKSKEFKPLGEYKKLSLSEEAEWMPYFNEQKQKAEELKAEIEKTDKEIDQMVYELYGLTEEEIAIVEEATK